MLRGISRLISPELLMTLMEMGHGDELVLADANFPAASHARRLVRADGVAIAPLLVAILPWFPLDAYVDHPVLLMQTEPQDIFTPPVWATYAALVSDQLSHGSSVDYLPRRQFYERARNAFAIVATGEIAQYGNILLTKGAIFD